MLWQLIIVLLVTTAWLLFTRRHSAQEDVRDSRCPIEIKPTIPYIGHVLGMLRQGSRYYAKISATCPAPVYCLPVPKGRIYIVKSPALAKIVDRNSQTISFNPYLYEFAKRILKPSAEGLVALKENMDGAEGQWGCAIETLHTMRNIMNPGEEVENLSSSFVQSIGEFFDTGLIKSVGSSTKTAGLFGTTRNLISRASTDTMYGRKLNPFRDPEVQDGFWAVDADFARLGMNFFPQIIARKAYKGREKVFKGFQKYYAAADWRENASEFIKARYRVNQKFISQEDIEHFDLSILVALLVNMSSAAAWALFYMYSCQDFLDALRKKCDELANSSDDTTSHQRQTRRTLSVKKLLEEFPLLDSMIQETLRVQSTNASGRIVLKDTVLSDRYLLKKDAFVLIPSAELHHDEEAWGPDRDEFNMHRFMPDWTGPKPNNSAIRSWGGGSNLCLGKFYAMNQIASIAVSFALKYDLKPVSGLWTMPERRPHITTSILTPVDELYVEITDRLDATDEGAAWEIHWD